MYVYQFAELPGATSLALLAAVALACMSVVSCSLALSLIFNREGWTQYYIASAILSTTGTVLVLRASSLRVNFERSHHILRL